MPKSKGAALTSSRPEAEMPVPISGRTAEEDEERDDRKGYLFWEDHSLKRYFLFSVFEIKEKACLTIFAML